MKHYEQISPAVLPRSRDVIALRCVESTTFDPAPLKTVVETRGPIETDELICRVLEDIAARLDFLQSELAKADFAPMIKPARRIALIAEQIGLTEVADSAGHVATCLTQGDGIALEATMARLERGFDAAVSDVWNFRDM